MRKTLGIIVLLVVIFAVGCASTTSHPAREFQINITPEKELPGVTIAVEPVWHTGLLGSGFEGFRLSIDNQSDNLIRISWERSSIITGSDSAPLFIEGQKYSDAGKPAPDMAIPSKTLIRKEIFSSTQPQFLTGSGWFMYPIASATVTLLINVQAAGNEDNYTIKVQ